ncbi:MAG: penicillin-binding protein 2, partial [Phycisphaerae bacterium]|nr:penicillin-binding protein 2 [Phycisphaerae bacterium]
DEADAARSLGLRGFGVQNEPVRRYPLGAALAQVLGFVSPDGKGITGIELQYDSHLCSYNGRITSIGDVGRNAIWRLERGTVPVTDGGHVMLTIDNVIQQLVEEQLEKRVRELKAESGVAVVMSPKTGDILAMACCPTFDPADYGSISQDWWRNRTVTDPVEPGSTFKPVVAGWALAKGFISRTETIFCHNGVYATSGRVLKDVKPHGNLDFAGILVHSSNIGMGIIGQRMGNSVLYEAVRRFGFGQPTGLGFPGESGGIVRALPDWAKLSSTSIPMGYEIGVTPLQLTTAYCAIVNGGILLKPRLVRALLAPEGTPCELSTGPQQIRQVLPEQTARYLAETVLPAVVTRDNSKGTESDYPMLGKTGTAKLLRKDGKRYADRAYLCSFVGAAPVDDPRVVVLVMVRRPDPDLGRFGRIVSMPVVRKIIDLTLSYLDTQSQPEA